MKLKVIKRTLIIQTIVVVLLVAFIFAPVIYVNYLYDDYSEQAKSMETNGNIISSELNNLKNQYEDANKNIALFKEIESKMQGKMLSVSKVILRDTIAELRKKYVFGEFDINMSDIKPKVGDKYKLTTLFSEDSAVSIKFSSLNDVDVFYLIKDLQKSFSALSFSSVKIMLDKSIDSSTLLEIRNSCFSSLIKGEILFTWSGIQNVKKDEGEALTDKDVKSPNSSGAQRLIRLRGQ